MSDNYKYKNGRVWQLLHQNPSDRNPIMMLLNLRNEFSGS